MKYWKSCCAVAIMFWSQENLPAAACEGASVVFSDKFATLSPAWQGFIPGTAAAVDGHLALKFPPGASLNTHMLNQSNVYQDVSICAKFKYSVTPDASQTGAGIVFWGLDDNSFYLFMTSPSGFFTVGRKIAVGRVIYPISWTASPAVKKDLNQTQELQVVTKGNVASFFIDGTKVAEVNGGLPAGGQLVGFWWQGPGASTTVVDDLIVKN